jgi:hypothetical protein
MVYRFCKVNQARFTMIYRPYNKRKFYALSLLSGKVEYLVGVIIAANNTAVFGELNHLLIQDEGHRSRMKVSELVNQMRSWLETEYQASIFEDDSGIVAYALYREEKDNIHLRQFFVER